MKKIHISHLVFILFLFSSHESLAQIPQVPGELQFADLIVRINPQARREIQLDVDAQYRNPTFFKVKQDRVNLYMPIIEDELRKAGAPLDLKYLAIQESSLIGDAVSTSNAVGFWQFKQGTAEEVFLRVDNQIDERKNIVSSTKGAALYLQKHNNTFDNWMCALVSYQMGLGGAKAYFGTEYNGKQVIDVDRNTHWYFKKFLAHKIAFGSQTTSLVSNGQYMVEERVQGPTTLAVLAKKYGVTVKHLEEYNLWTRNGKIPGDRVYTVIYVKDGSLPIQQAVIVEQKPQTQQIPSTTTAAASRTYKQADSFPRIAGNTTKASQADQITVNNLEGVQAAQSTNQSAFSDRVGLSENKLRRLNDLDKNERIEAGKYYYTEKKNGSAEVSTHIVRPGETLWSISQKYGIKLSSLKSKNRIRQDRDLKAGMVLNLQEHRKRGDDIPIVKLADPAPVRQTTANPTPTRPSNQPATTTAPPSRPASTTNITHTVATGETLFAISKKYGVTVNQLKAWNNIGSQNIISIGQKLVIFRP
ncbi:membrane-bound lytic murein transglycosylase D [Algoriphagus ratkowskyi]|uniref:LysM peptidoglycan-binding domain-containing protein n=1 Tax=Algoriphagus ratkowskyi TaxID=57028 RepID=A0A2W7S8P7_9BACT|nr:LysM peptidoglycan-binding domain-containing protein [Algoriphagus ratkowskyi]PZX59315.1 membrane-bound lytic murein transglycosylase D [Algoriphagus ratkowskyi]TXD77416.1 LysM peptidoglycan-binding domain-containing protein [Algoriphagus ratkowskyi]